VARRRHNTQTPRDRQRLVEDFEQRVRYTEEEGDARRLLRRPRSLAWVVHPLADETELLNQIGITADDCWSADAYWRYVDRVYFVQLHGEGHFKGDAGLYYCFDRVWRQDVFDICLPRPVVTTADFHHTFELLEALIDGGRVDAERAMLKDDGGRWSARRELLAQVE
jgi:hypothetical protein